MRIDRWFRRLQENRAVALAQVFALFAFTLAFLTVDAISPERVNAYESPTGTWSAPVTGATDTSNVTYPSGVQVTATTTGATDLSTTSTLGSRGFDQTQYTPTNMVTGDTAANVIVNTPTCASTGVCPNLGTLTFTFSQPVRNPIIQLSGMGGAAKSGLNQSDLHSVFDLTTAGATLTKVDGNTQLSVPTTTRITAANDSASGSCTTATNTGGTNAAAATAACGSVQVNGTFTTISFNISAVFIQNPSAPGPANIPGSGDGVNFTVTLPQDYSDAPASFNGTQAPAHVLSNLTLGATVDEDNLNIRNSTTSPFPGAAANGDGADEDAFTTLPTILTNAGTYSLTVPIAGLSKAARLCGWIDFNQNGSFDAGERACASPAAGATSAALSWTLPAGMVPGTSYARFRLGYTATQVESPTGLADSGEVEDYTVVIADPPKVTIAKVSNGGTATFPFTVTGATIGTDSVTTTSAGSALASTTLHIGTAGTAVTVSETVPAGWRATTATCTDTNSAVSGNTNPVNAALSGYPVAAGGTASITVPAANAKNNAVITCTFTNEKLASLTIRKVQTNGAPAFSFTATGTGLPATFSLNPTGSGGTAQQTFSNLTPGASYSVSEIVTGTVDNAGYSLASLSCVDNTGAPAGSVFTPTVLNNATTFGTVTVNPLVAGANVTCTFVDVVNPRITMIKQTTGGNGTFGFTASTSAGNLSSTTPSITTASGSGFFEQRITGLGAGTATVTFTENAPASPFVFTSVSCVNVATGASVGTVTGRQVVLTGVVSGSEITCTWVNKVQPTIKLRKVSTNSTGSFNFSSSIFPSSPVAITTTTAGTPATPTGDPTYTVAPDQAVTITEAVPANWTLAGVQCINTDSNSVEPTTFNAAGQLTIPATTLVGGADLVCTFTDTRNARTLTVTKATVPTTDAGQFQMNANGTVGVVGGNGVQASATVLAGATATFAEAAASGRTSPTTTPPTPVCAPIPAPPSPPVRRRRAASRCLTRTSAAPSPTPACRRRCGLRRPGPAPRSATSRS